VAGATSRTTPTSAVQLIAMANANRTPRHTPPILGTRGKICWVSEASHLTEARVAYDIVAADYAERSKEALAEAPLERALLGTFAELVRAGGGGPVADVGCGPGRITTYLDSLGLDVTGIDLSPGMIEVARRAYPGLEFRLGTMADLDVKDGALGGLVAWYSIIHTPPELLPAVFAEFARVLAPGGHLLLAFQAGDERVHIEQAFGHEVSVHAYRLSPDRIVELLAEAGIVLGTRVVREPEGREKTPQAWLMARKADLADPGASPIKDFFADQGRTVVDRRSKHDHSSLIGEERGRGRVSRGGRGRRG
jgi:SAM-dependent methyltransferase